MHAGVSDHAGPGRPRVNAAARVAFRFGNTVGTRDKSLSRLDGQPARSPADASPPPSRGDARLGASVVRYAFTVEDFHLLLLAGLPAHYQPPKRLTHAQSCVPMDEIRAGSLTRNSQAALHAWTMAS